MEPTQQLNNKRKKPRFFELYIGKVLKNISDTNGIANNPRQQLNSILTHLATIIADKTEYLTKIANKKTISVKEITNAIKICFPAEISKNIITNAEKAVKVYEENNNSKINTRQDKAGITFPPAICEKYIRQSGTSKLMVTSHPPIYLAVALEYVTTDILENALNIIKDTKKVRLSIRELQLSVFSDPELEKLFTKNNLRFMGGGVNPYIHPNLLCKKPRKIKKAPADGASDEQRKKHRFRPGTVAVREIRKFQKTNNSVILAKLPFQQLIRKKLQELLPDNNNIKVSKEVFIILQYFIEEELINILHDANYCAMHAGRIKILPVDIDFTMFIKYGKNNPYKSNSPNMEVLDVSDIKELDVEDDEDILEEVA